jgi:hypothetical protein
MIQITAYLRTEEDLTKWKTIKNKTEWLHDMLNQNILVPKMPIITKPEQVPKMLKNVRRITNNVDTAEGFIDKKFSARRKK